MLVPFCFCVYFEVVGVAIMLYYDEISTVLDYFPEVEFAFAYGSGVIEQSGYNYQPPSKQATTDYPMVDFIFVVKDSESWHKENLQKNPDHYSSLIPMKERSIAWFQDNIPAHFWFNAYAPFPLKEDHPHKGKLLMKYGVINQQNAVKDLSEWTNLYLAGRLHKPVRILRSNSQYDQLMSFNRDSAIKTSLLLLPERFSEMDLYLSIAGLSYLGDIRMRVGAENPKKVSNLVTPIVNHYQKLYQGNVIASNQFFTKNDTHFLQVKLSMHTSFILLIDKI